MSKKTPPDRDIERARQSLASGAGEADSADISWARQILLGNDSPPPGDALRPEVAYALVEELIDRQESEMLARLAQSHHRAVAKAARTGLYRMRSHKVPVEIPVEAEHPHEGTGVVSQQTVKSMVTIYDSRWERLVWLADDSPGGLRIYQGRLSALFGLLELHGAATTRKEFRGKARQILDELGGEMVEQDDARWLIRDAARRSEEHGRSLPRGYAAASQGLGPARRAAHPALDIVQGEAGSSASLLALYDLPELRFWLPDREFLHRLSLRTEEAKTSRIVLNEAQRCERLADIVERSVADFYTSQRCQACRTLLLDVAHIFLARGATDRATALRRAAEQYLGTPDEVAARPFPRHLVERVVMQAQSAGHGAEHNHDHEHDHEHEHEPAHEAEQDGGGSTPRGGLILP